MSNKGTGLFDDKYNMGLVDANKLKTYLNNHNQAVGSDGKVYNNMESDYVAGKNMLDDFASMLSKDDIELDVEKSKVIENKQKNTTELASQEKLDPAQEEFFAQLSKKLKLDVEVCKKVFEEESNEFKELHEMHSQLIELTEFKYMALQVDDYSQCRELLLEISKVRKQRIHFLSEINLSDKLNSVLTKHKDHEKMSNADFLAELEKRKNQRLLSL